MASIIIRLLGQLASKVLPRSSLKLVSSEILSKGICETQINVSINCLFWFLTVNTFLHTFASYYIDRPLDLKLLILTIYGEEEASSFSSSKGNPIYPLKFVIQKFFPCFFFFKIAFLEDYPLQCSYSVLIQKLRCKNFAIEPSYFDLQVS